MGLKRKRSFSVSKMLENHMTNPNETRTVETPLSARERIDVEGRLRPRVPMLYEIVRKEGEAELKRPVSGLWWSGIAAGLCIGFSMVAEGLIRARIPDTAWRPLIDNFGYSTGFLIVILGRQQLFTENTLTAVLPVMARRTRSGLMNMFRLWAVVFAANLVGAFLFALFCCQAGIFSPEVEAAFSEIAQHMTDLPPLETFWRESDAGPPRQYYELTAAGRDHLATLKNGWTELSHSVDLLLERNGAERARPAGDGGEEASILEARLGAR